jgi:hypothetical protein
MSRHYSLLLQTIPRTFRATEQLAKVSAQWLAVRPGQEVELVKLSSAEVAAMAKFLGAGKLQQTLSELQSGRP